MMHDSGNCFGQKVAGSRQSQLYAEVSNPIVLPRRSAVLRLTSPIIIGETSPFHSKPLVNTAGQSFRDKKGRFLGCLAAAIRLTLYESVNCRCRRGRSRSSLACSRPEPLGDCMCAASASATTSQRTLLEVTSICGVMSKGSLHAAPARQGRESKAIAPVGLMHLSVHLSVRLPTQALVGCAQSPPFPH